ncbi:MAG TPA: hypothetical protein VKA30_05570 [Actinomycetota bacterium]|nr:hypothetical protein [Actinomycetota bacterium]
MIEPEICRKCGTPRLSEAGYCVTCGTKFSKDSPRTAEPQSEGEGAVIEAEGPARRRWGLIAVAAGLAVLLGIGAFIFFTGGAETGSAYALQFSKASPGDTYRYHMTMVMDLTMSSKELGLDQPIRGTADMVTQFRVVSVDKDEVATVEFSVKEGTVESDGVKQAAPDTSVTMRIAPDGRLIDINGTPLGADSPLSGGLPGADQLTPVLPPHAVKPGDTWSKDYEVPFPFGGTLKYSSNNRFLRYEPVDGVRAAVIRSDVAAPMDTDLDLAAFSKLFGAAGGDLPQQLSGVTIHLGGRLSSIGTSWVDLASGRWFKSITTGLVDMEFTMKDLPADAGVSEATFVMRGTMDVTIENLGETAAAAV